MKHGLPPTSSAIHRILQQSPNSDVDFATVFPDPLGLGKQIPSCAVVAMIASAALPPGSLSLAWVPKMEQPVDPFAPKNTTVTASPELGGSDTSAVEGVEDIEFVFEKSIVGYSKFATAKRLKRLEAALDSISTLKSTATSFPRVSCRTPCYFGPNWSWTCPGPSV